MSLRRVGILQLASFFTLAALATAQDIRVTNTAKYVGSGRYDWTVSLVAPDAVLSRIKYVEYTLHPSFPNPVRRVENRQTKFALSSNGWGEFNIAVKVVEQSGAVRYLNHRLTLEQKPTTAAALQARPAPPHRHGAVTTDNIATYVGENRWNWTVFIAADEKTLQEVRCVEYTLHPTFPDPIREVCDRGRVGGPAFPLSANGWGTFGIGVKITFGDGEVRYLTHQLSFVRQKD